MARRNNESFAVIGLGAFGRTMACELARFGNPVLGLDIEEKNVSRVATRIPPGIRFPASQIYPG